jgi:hypothetical protein
MSNIIERHPGYTLLLMSIAVMTTTWAILTFVLEDNKINFYKAQIESIKAETENIKSENSTYRSRIEFLEKENEKLNSINTVYLDYVSKNPNAIPFLQKRIQDLVSENYNLKNGSDINKTDTLSNATIDKPKNTAYNAVAELSRGEAYLDERTDLVVGLNEVDIDRNAAIKIVLPSGTEKNEKASAGKSYVFKSKNKDYILLIKQVDYYSNRLVIQVKEK